jgi:hypothetical protein
MTYTEAEGVIVNTGRLLLSNVIFTKQAILFDSAVLFRGQTRAAFGPGRRELGVILTQSRCLSGRPVLTPNNFTGQSPSWKADSSSAVEPTVHAPSWRA